MTKQTLPFGAWPSPISAAGLVSGASAPSDVAAEGGVPGWSQSRPDQGGRQQVLRRDPDGSVSDVFGADFNARTRVHEYGGGAWWVHDGVVFAVSWADQRLSRSDGDGPLTAQPRKPGGVRYA